MRSASPALAVLALVACADGDPVAPGSTLPVEVAFAATTDAENDIVEFSGITYVPCGNGGTGEFVFLEGPLHSATHEVTNAAGQTMLVVQVNPMGIRGVGELSGDRFAGTGMFHDRFTQDGAGQTYTAINNFRLIGRNGAPSLRVHVVTRIVWDGAFTTTEFELSRITCS